MATVGEGLLSGSKVRSREKAEMAALYTGVMPGAQRLAYLLCGDADIASDLAQEAFVKAYARVSRIGDAAAVEAYLRQTIVNLVRHRARKKRIERAYAHLFAVPREGAPPPAGGDEGLWQALSRLPARQRAVIVLRYHMDLSERQTADVLGCSVAAIKSLNARGIRTLRSALKEEDDDAG